MKDETFILGGGLDLTSPVLSAKKGKALVAINYELGQTAGYRRTRGYERFDGRASPSSVETLEDRETLRALIQTVPGSGPVRGVFYLEGERYAMRDTADGLAKKLYRATTGGWVEVTTPALNPGGQLRWITHNFFGGVDTNAVYGVTSVDKAFQFDGTTYTEITTGAEPLFPTRIAEFNNHLVLAYPGASLQGSATGVPLDYTALNGAFEIGVGYDIDEIYELIGGVLGIFMTGRIKVLRGDDADNFVLSDFSESGVKRGTVQPLFSDAIFVDDQIQLMSASDTFGDFQAGTLSEAVRPIVERFNQATVFSAVSKRKNQYMLFGPNREVLVTSFNGGRLAGFTTLSFLHDFTYVYTFKNDEDIEEIYACGENGYVYKLDTGSSFDGQAIQSFLLLMPTHCGAYNQNKRFKKITVESDASAQSSLFVYAEYNYGALPRSVETQFDTRPQGGIWNTFQWNQAFWSSDLKGYAVAYPRGVGRNIAVFIFNESRQDTEFTLQSIAIGFKPRGLVR